MTFSDTRIEKLVRENFVPVWESVAPVKVAVFDLGEGKQVRGAVGGEIAVYFCRPDGKVFDIFPGLQSPYVTRLQIEKALDFYRRTGAADEAIAAYHREELAKALAAEQAEAQSDPGKAPGRTRRADRGRLKAGDPATRALVDIQSKSGLALPEPMVIAVPGGLGLYKRQVHERFAKGGELRTPDQWKREIFEEILEQELRGGEFLYKGDERMSMMLIDE